LVVAQGDGGLDLDHGGEAERATLLELEVLDVRLVDRLEGGLLPRAAGERGGQRLGDRPADPVPARPAHQRPGGRAPPGPPGPGRRRKAGGRASRWIRCEAASQAACTSVSGASTTSCRRHGSRVSTWTFNPPSADIGGVVTSGRIADICGASPQNPPGAGRRS